MAAVGVMAALAVAARAGDGGAGREHKPLVKRIWAGIDIGYPATNDFPPAAPGTVPYTGPERRQANFRSVAGLMVDGVVGGNWSIDAEALYRRLFFPENVGVVVTLEIPVMAKYTFAETRLKPFVEAGPSYRLTANLNNANPSHGGFTAGAGVTAYWGRARFTPGVHYTHWAHDLPTDIRPQANTRVDQVELLVGLTF